MADTCTILWHALTRRVSCQRANYSRIRLTCDVRKPVVTACHVGTGILKWSTFWSRQNFATGSWTLRKLFVNSPRQFVSMWTPMGTLSWTIRELIVSFAWTSREQCGSLQVRAPKWHDLPEQIHGQTSCKCKPCIRVRRQLQLSEPGHWWRLLMALYVVFRLQVPTFFSTLPSRLIV
jgi:hypothetical protein